MPTPYDNHYTAFIFDTDYEIPVEQIKRNFWDDFAHAVSRPKSIAFGKLDDTDVLIREVYGIEPNEHSESKIINPRLDREIESISTANFLAELKKCSERFLLLYISDVEINGIQGSLYHVMCVFDNKSQNIIQKFMIAFHNIDHKQTANIHANIPVNLKVIHRNVSIVNCVLTYVNKYIDI